MFNKIVDSSLWGEEDYVIKVFLSMWAKRDWEDVVYGNAYNIAMWARKDEATVIKALAILAAPDTKRIEPQEYDGRRIEKVEGGWKILNGQAYRDLVKQQMIRDQKARWQAKERAVDKEARELLKDKINTMTPEEFEAMVKLAKRQIKARTKQQTKADRDWKERDPNAPAGPLPGERAFLKAEKAGAPPAVLDALADKCHDNIVAERKAEAQRLGDLDADVVFPAAKTGTL